MVILTAGPEHMTNNFQRTRKGPEIIFKGPTLGWTLELSLPKEAKATGGNLVSHINQKSRPKDKSVAVRAHSVWDQRAADPH